MAEEIYSRALSPEARRALIEFFEAYLESMKTQKVDEKAEIAKAKAIEALKTDIDILVFVAAIAAMHSPQGISLMMEAVTGRMSSGQVATFIADITERGRLRDKQSRLD